MFDTPDPSDMLSVQQAAARCGVAERTVRRWVGSGRLSAVSGPRGTRISLAALEPFIAQYRQASGSVRTESDLSDPADGPVSDLAAATAEPSGQTGLPSDHAAALELVQLVERQQQTIMELAGRVGYYQAETEQLRAQLALEAPNADTTGWPSEAGETATGHLAT